LLGLINLVYVIIMPLSSISNWKDYFANNKAFDSSNAHLVKIKNSVNTSTPFVSSFEEISKNPGVAFLSLDPLESYLQLFHHGAIIGGSWGSPSKIWVSILGFDDTYIVARAFFEQMYNYDSQLPDQTSMDNQSPVDRDPELIDEAYPNNSSTSNDTMDMATDLSNNKTGGSLPKFMSEFITSYSFATCVQKGKCLQSFTPWPPPRKIEVGSLLCR
jgi:hypothetical protein